VAVVVVAVVVVAVVVVAVVVALSHHGPLAGLRRLRWLWP
jgi:hypothetical protein